MSPPVPGHRRDATYGVVVPVKPRAVAKSRLSALGDEARRELVTAFAVDTVLAAAECAAVGTVLVVTDDVVLAGAVRDLGVGAIPDGRPGSLNDSLVQGAAEVARRFPGLRPVALCGDLPALRSADLDGALHRAPEDVPGFVPDAAGVGTTLYTAPDLARFSPLFGSESRRAHLKAGATELTGAAPSLRRDVDSPEDLDDAIAMGVGTRTSSVVTRRGLAVRRS